MDRKTFLAILLIMTVLLVDQVLWSRWTKPRHPIAPADSIAATGGGTGVPTGAPAAPDAVAPGGGAPGPGVRAGNAPATPPSLAVAGKPSSMAGLPGERVFEARVRPAPRETFTLETGRFDATFSSDGGAISSWVLDQYRDPLLKEPVNLVPIGQSAMHVVVGLTGAAYDFSNATFSVIGSNPAEGWVSYAAQDSVLGIRVTKTYRRARDPQILDVEVRVSAPADLGPLRYRMGWVNPLPLTEVNAKPLEQTAVAYLGDKLETVDDRRITKEGSKRLEGNVRWAGERSKYFLAALIPDSATVSEVVFLPGPEKRPSVWLAGAAPPGTEIVRHARLYAGPIHFDALIAIGAGLEEVANLGWKWIVPVSALLLKSLTLLHGFVPNYGIAIILISLLTKLIFYPLSQSSLRTMKVMHRLQPEVNAIRDKYADDPAKMNQAMMSLYKEHKVNPMGGCLPMLLQLPVFLALYQVLLHAIELRAAGFVGYIQDLSAPDVLARVGSVPIHLLPILMTGSTFLLQSQTPVDPRQRFMMYVMPVMMLYIMYNLPSGVILYWTVNNLVSALQQYLVNVAEDRKAAATA
ncbi:MAG TPA: membrane protein insertase YidC [Candidatus Eisenbacteria bacterium]